MTQTAKITWVDPTTKFTGVEVAMRVSGATDFTVLATIAPGVQTDTVPDLADGTYDFRVTAMNGSLRAPGVVVSGTVSTEVAPDNVTGVTVTFS